MPASTPDQPSSISPSPGRGPDVVAALKAAHEAGQLGAIASLICEARLEQSREAMEAVLGVEERIEEEDRQRRRIERLMQPDIGGRRRSTKRRGVARWDPR